MKYLLVFLLAISLFVARPVLADSSAATAIAGNATASAQADAVSSYSQSSAGSTDADATSSNASASAQSGTSQAHATSHATTKTPAHAKPKPTPPTKVVIRTVAPSTQTAFDKQIDQSVSNDNSKIAIALPITKPNEPVKNLTDRLKASRAFSTIVIVFLLLVVLAIIIALLRYITRKKADDVLRF